MIKKIMPRQIWLQIFCILLLLVVIPLVLLGMLLINTSQNALKVTVLRDHREIAIHTTGEVKEYIKGPRQALNVTAATLGVLDSNPWKQETAIIELALRYPIFERISSIDMSGQEIATSQLGTALVSRSNDIEFLKAMDGKEFISDVKFSENYIPMLVMTTPIKELGHVVGVLRAAINLRGVWDIVDSIKIGKTGRAYLIDDKGSLLSHPDKKLILKRENPINPKIIREVLSGAAGSLEDVDTQGEKWLVSYAPVDSMNWGLVIAQTAKEAFGFSTVMKIQSWVLIVLSIVATIIMSFVVSRIMSRPIQAMIKAMKCIAQGNFDYRFHNDRKDEIGKLYHSFNGMTQKLKDARRLEKLSTIGKAATAIAHELKNSLVLVNTYIRLLPERHKDKNFVDEFSRTVPRELDAWKGMLQNMTNYSKFYQFQKGEVNINEVIKDVAFLAHQRAKQNGINFVIQTRNDLPSINGNSDKLRQVFLNLINNALQSTPAGGSITMSTDFLEISELWKSPCIKVQIDDTGDGIPNERLDKIFEPFFTTRDDGLGLGLAVSKEIIDFHGGSIEASNRLRSGSSFSVTLPVMGESGEGKKKSV